MSGHSFVATVSLVFGVISAIFTAIISLVYLGIMVAVNLTASEATDYYPFSAFPPKVVAAANVFLVVVTVKFLVDFLFSVLLCDGICKKNAGYVRAYFIYGIVMASLGALVDMVVFACDWQAGFTILSMLVAYCLILHMVRMALQEMTAGQVYQYSHKLMDKKIFIG